ncbi:hypothetical protein SAMN05444370_13412 [Rubrimonas cliftonensis]|uniref:Uncharacterized protein n=1 Tax=Rubrimonas cliftonensis TaxID=89524 RepID=A0A1H4G3F3_9RHOB|nr:hypothetical protein SAMN05444370_13412 [Rubrimonas cliftonensis]
MPRANCAEDIPDVARPPRVVLHCLMDAALILQGAQARADGLADRGAGAGSNDAVNGGRMLLGQADGALLDGWRCRRLPPNGPMTAPPQDAGAGRLVRTHERSSAPQRTPTSWISAAPTLATRSRGPRGGRPQPRLQDRTRAGAEARGGPDDPLRTWRPRQPARPRARRPGHRRAKLRCFDLARLCIGDLVSGGQNRRRATAARRGTGRPVQFEPSETTRAPVRKLLTLRAFRSRNMRSPTFCMTAPP